MESWFYVANGEKQGPVSLEQIRELIESGSILIGTLVWTTGMAEWVPAGDTALATFMERVTPPPTAYCHKCGAEIVVDASFCTKCGTSLLTPTQPPPLDVSAEAKAVEFAQIGDVFSIVVGGAIRDRKTGLMWQRWTVAYAALGRVRWTTAQRSVWPVTAIGGYPTGRNWNRLWIKIQVSLRP